MKQFLCAMKHAALHLHELSGTRALLLLLLALALVLPAACLWQPKLSETDPSDPGHFRIARFDRIESEFVATGNLSAWQTMNTDFPRETQALVEDVLRLGPVDGDSIDTALRTYFADSTLVKLRRDVWRRFERLDSVELSLATAFQRLKKECPEFVIPHVYTQISALGQSIVIGDSLIGISLDKYLGADYPLYQKYFYPNQRASMEPVRMVQDCLTLYLSSLYRCPTPKGSKHPMLRDVMMHQGIMYWVTAKLLGVDDLVDIAACHPKTKAWYRANVARVRTTMLEPAMQRDTTFRLRRNTIMTATPEPYFRDNHSRGVGLYAGMLLVDDYMKRHPDTTIDQILHMQDYEAMLKEVAQ